MCVGHLYAHLGWKATRGHRGQVSKLNALNRSLEWDCSFRVIGSKASLVRYHLKDVAVKAKE